jgi:hypothetical protein
MPVVRFSAAEHGGIILPMEMVLDVGDLVVTMAAAGAGAERLPAGSLTNVTPLKWEHERGGMYVVETEAADPPETCTVNELPPVPKDNLERMCAVGKIAVPARRAFKVPSRANEAFILATQVHYTHEGETFLAADHTRVYEVITALSESLLTRLAAVTPPLWQ